MPLPERLGRLRRVDRLGVGGFATVWLYHDEELQSDVAVKALADNWAQRLDIRDRFLEEARILRRADCDHVVRVYDVGEADDTPYFVMTYADSGSMARLTDSGVQVAPAKVLDLIGQAGDGLHVLHELGVIHRDIKPPNLLLRGTGDGGVRVLIADLGVAKAAEHASGLTQVVGTPAYMAPEQAGGMGIDKRADIHALAAVTYHLLTGTPVRTSGLAELAHATLPPPPSSIAEVPREVDAVILRALDPDPEARYDDVLGFVAALRETLAPENETRAEDETGQDIDPARDPAQHPTRVEARNSSGASAGNASADPAGNPGRWPLLVSVFILVLLGSFAVTYLLTR